MAEFEQPAAGHAAMQDVAQHIVAAGATRRSDGQADVFPLGELIGAEAMARAEPCDLHTGAWGIDGQAPRGEQQQGLFGCNV